MNVRLMVSDHALAAALRAAHDEHQRLRENVLALVDQHVARGERVEYPREGAFGGRAVTISKRGDLCDLRDDMRRLLGNAALAGGKGEG